MLENIVKVLTVYLETSVISGYGRKRFHKLTMEFFDLIKRGWIKPIISTHTLDELADKRTPQEVMDNLYTIEFNTCEATAEMVRLRELYLQKRIITDNDRPDAFHVAIATILEVDVLATWNMRHIVNPNNVPLFNKVNEKEGFKKITILKPEEIIIWLKKLNSHPMTPTNTGTN
jgi:predicted nucleic acid-binding protein